MAGLAGYKHQRKLLPLTPLFKRRAGRSHLRGENCAFTGL